MSSGSARYSTGAIIIHWLTAALMIFMLFFGEDLIKVPDGQTLADKPFASLHATFGMLILVLTIARIAWLFAKPAPAPLPQLKRSEVIVAKSVQGLYYLLLIAIPLSGWLALSGYGNQVGGLETVKLFKTFAIPQAPDVGRWVGEAHEIMSKLAILLLALHVLGALKHQFIGKLPLMQRMSFFR